MPTARILSSVGGTRGVGATSSNQSVGLQNSRQGRDKPAAKTHKRSRSGCFTCRLRRKKCDEGHPSCKACTNLSVKCEYKRPVWWGSPEQRRLQKERIKDIIKKTKSLERSASNSENGGRVQTCISPPPMINEHDFNRPIVSDLDSFGPHYAVPGFVPITYSHHFAPYEVDVKTERQTFVNDVPLRHDSSVSTFSAMGPPQLHATLPTFPADEWFQEEYFEPPHEYRPDESALESHGMGQSYASLHANIPVDDYDRPLLNHFVENVLRMIFPILEVHQRGSARARAVLQSLETNKSYFHCCLSVAAIHLKTTSGLNNEQIDHDIMRHRYEAISELCQSLNKDADHEHILDATLAMIFFHCAVGAPDDCLPDIHWSDHFQAVSNLVDKLDLTNTMEPCGNAYMVPPFSMSLTSWIDILGATMLGETPQFAHTYRNKHLSGASSGLRELMGCDDRVMYLISEIACLESLKSDGRIDSITLCTHVSALGNQLEYTEPADPSLGSPYSSNGSIRPEVLTKSMTAMFRLAARIYLCSLVPGADRNHSSTRNLVSAVADTLAYIPAGQSGFDRSLVWPLLITGANSTPGSTFRQAMNDRIIALGELADFGSFGRMFQLMTEFWRLTDDPVDSPVFQDASYEAVYQAPQTKYESSDSPPLPSPGMRAIKRQQVHWRDVMNRNGWRYLLI